MVVYMDVVWLLNLLVDSMLLWLTAIILKRHVTIWRIFIGGLIGSILIIMSITPYAQFAGKPLVKLGFSVIMVYSVFGFKRFKFFFSNLLTFYFMTFLTGGILIGVHYFLNFDLEMNKAFSLASIRGFGDPISWMFVIFGLPIAWYFAKQRITTFEMTKIQFDQLVEVEININGLHIVLPGLVDSGNQLQDPISKAPVMIVSTQTLLEKLPNEIIELSENHEKLMDGSIQLDSEWYDKIRLIPAKAVGKNHQLLVAYKPDSLHIQNEKGSWNVQKSLISFTNQTLSSDDIFQCIVHPKMLTGIPIQHAS
ncbi:peptidase [Heyndrickxia shackletonii]|uniref:Sporulation sigma-E factor-processing peptidase n=1 Tax=Heyndrickxia shackletonii TaxID=157838 RepID=A0A0Q3WYW9_9BACI|nr:sigma-E processing peptidase SpoIIGA [Heyndrickxia shackletonii]KQL54711.1 peptidase [Heyndrickxia shackletonii]MBB2478753.1 sigma-E processing peptidase SpoIIGA [Bacillus sp. APMAM]NEY98364.1 sigma-E processing peptidase SpoIIGA [Heyndrickxia shackletonii]RTZ57923.1 sigma-E processing peptidase SpoIIGA [Bacillus sp. SAJ1]